LAGCRGGGKHLVVHRDEERAETVGLREERVEARGERLQHLRKERERERVY
jgi:hypothetical protein